MCEMDFKPFGSHFLILTAKKGSFARSFKVYNKILY